MRQRRPSRTIRWADSDGSSLAETRLVSPLPSSAYIISPEPAPLVGALDATFGRRAAAPESPPSPSAAAPANEDEDGGIRGDMAQRLLQHRIAHTSVIITGVKTKPLATVHSLGDRFVFQILAVETECAAGSRSGRRSQLNDSKRPDVSRFPLLLDDGVQKALKGGLQMGFVVNQ
jgi:hypothetical protein